MRERKIDIEPDWVHLGVTENGIAAVSYTHLLAVPVINDNPEYKFEIGKGVELRKGKDITIFATGLCVSET